MTLDQVISIVLVVLLVILLILLYPTAHVNEKVFNIPKDVLDRFKLIDSSLSNNTVSWFYLHELVFELLIPEWKKKGYSIHFVTRNDKFILAIFPDPPNLKDFLSFKYKRDKLFQELENEILTLAKNVNLTNVEI